MTPFPNSEILIDRVGWLLFHSLWQFTLIGIAAALLFWLLRGARPATRYALGLACFTAIVLAPIITWPFIQIAPPILATSATSIPMELAFPSPAPHIAAPPLNHVNPLDIPTTARNFPIEAPNDRPHTITSAVAPPVPPIPWTERLTIVLNPWLETCVALWCGGVLLFSLRPLIGWIAQRRLRRIGTHPLTVQLAGTWEQARQRLRIRQRVQLLQSTLAPGPMVVGYLRPVILLPTTVVNSLPARRIEAILLHELAHIRRHDWLVNTLQTLVETLFFHHPAVWWLSARIRHERELCCDEIAAQALGDRAEYGRALVDLENLRDAPALALGARGGSLLDRIRRLTRTEVPRSNSTALVSLAVATLLLISLGAWSVGEAEGKQRLESPDSLLMSLDEQKAWEELIAMNLNSPEISRRNMRLQRLKRVETSHFPDDQIQELRRQLQEPIRSMHPWNIPEEAWPLIARLKSLETLTVTAGDLPRIAFESIAKLPKLKSLRVINARCLPTDAVALKKATNLEELDFMFTVFDMSPESRQEMIGEQTSAEQAWAESYRKEYDNREHIIEAAILTDRMLEELRDLPNLKRIALTNTSVSSRGAVAIASHAGLERLDVNFVDFSSEAARAIGSLKELRHFQVADGANDETLSHLAGLTNLEFLQLWGNSITDAGTTHLTKLQSLRDLNLYNSSLSDSGLLELAKLRQLKRLQLGSSKTTFTPEGIAEFRRLLPECELVVTEPKIESLSLDSMGADGPPTANADGADSMSHGDEQVRIPDDIPWGPESNGLRVRIIPVAPGTIPKGAKSPQRANQFVTSDDMIFLVELKNVSDEVIHLPGIHDSPAFPIMPEIRSHNDLARLFEVEFTDVSGNPVSGLKREIVNDIIREVVHPIAIGDTVRVVLAPGRFSSPLDHQLPKGEYTVKISYMGLKDDFISLAPGGKESNADSWQGRATSQAATFSIQQTPPSLAENELVWGEPTNGLQAAVKFSTPPDDPPIQYPPNNVPLNSRVDITFHIRNVSDTPISFASETWRQGDQLTIRNMRGDPREVNSTWYSGIPTLARWTLQPGETAKIRTASLGIADKAHQSPNSDRPEAFDYPAGYRWYAEKGIYSVQFTIRSPSVTRGLPDGKQFFPSETDWKGELTTGKTLINVLATAK